ncbi:MAG: hypothetical protein EXR01_03110 [Acetobacteraceae bacterium]|nr:hypothetical protein [Acetobacteraceae bacterium]
MREKQRRAVLELLGLWFAHAIMQDRVPSTQAYNPHAYIFEMVAGSYIAFFELTAAAAAKENPNMPDRVHGLA